MNFFRRNKPESPSLPADFESDHQEIFGLVRKETMTSAERIYSLIEATKYVISNKIEGDIVECGVWRGGSMMTVLEVLRRNNCTDRNIYLYDTYEGMPPASNDDVSITGQVAKTYLSEVPRTESDFVWAYSTLDTVKKNIYSIDYDKQRIFFVKGKVEETIPSTCPGKIALLRLDTDWYESTKHELIHLYPRLSSGGVLIIDDYGHWKGARKAVDEYLRENNINLFLSRIDYTARIAIKP